MKIMVHANGRLPVEFAVEAGCDSIEHGFFMGGENLKKMADRQIFWVPTAVTMQALAANTPQSGAALKILENQLEQMRRARELGVPIVAGTDAGSFGVRHGMALAEELALMLEAGFPPRGGRTLRYLCGRRASGLDRARPPSRGMDAGFIVVPGPPSDLWAP